MDSIYRITNLTKSYPLPGRGIFNRSRKAFEAVDNVSFDIRQGETFGIVGESGSGKTTLARLLLRLIEPTSGNVFFKNRDIFKLNRSELKSARKQIQMIFQDPYSSLDPRKSIVDIIAEPLKVHNFGSSSLIRDRIMEILELVDLPTSDDFLSKIPGEISGGQRQRVGIARALVIKPEFVVADEPVSMLDAGIKAGIIELMTQLKEKIDLTYVFITHELALAYHFCDRIAVMYLGEVVEIGNVEDVIHSPVHPYTRLLIDAIPPIEPDPKWLDKPFGKSDFSKNSKGCKFYVRCPNPRNSCLHTRPNLTEIRQGHRVACQSK